MYTKSWRVRKAGACIIACMLACMPCIGHAVEGDAYLSEDDLRMLEPTYTKLLTEMADLLIERGLLPEGDRESWMLYQLGDFMQNGGFGTVAIIYTPGLLSRADESVTMRRLRAETSAGTVVLQTLHRYVPDTSPLPGLPLDVELQDVNGEVLPCRFRWIASDGSLVIWDGSMGQIDNVGATYINDGRAMYWSATPVDGIEETLRLEILSATEDVTLAHLSLRLLSGPNFWSPEGLQ